MLEVHYIGTETIHNWTTRYKHLDYYANLSAKAHRAILMAHRAHHNEGKNAREAAEELVARFPDELIFTW